MPLPVVWAAWKDVPQPTAARRPAGRRRSVGTAASHSGCAKAALRVFSPALLSVTTPSIPSGRWTSSSRFSLPNGLRVLTASMPQAQSVSCVVMLAAGSRYESAETNGIAHFAEHMFFKGTERRPAARDLATEIDAIGGEFNAFTGKEYTGYYVRCAAETRDTALDVLVDMLRNSRFDPEEIEREKGVIIEEMNMYFDTPRDFIGGVYESLLYGDQPLGWDIIGRKETIRGAKRDTFTEYVDHWYRPNRMVVGVGGQIGEGLRERIERAARRPRAARDRRAGARRPRRERLAREGAHEAVRPGAHRARRAQPAARRPRPVCAAARRDRARGRHVVTALHRGARAPWARATTSSARTTRTPTPARSTRSRASTSAGSTTR